MKILFDQGTPVPLKSYLPGHTIETAFDRGWEDMSNGDLIQSSEDEGFHALVTTDQNLKYQQNFLRRSIAIVVLKRTSWPRIKKVTDEILDVVNAFQPGDDVEVVIPE